MNGHIKPGYKCTPTAPFDRKPTSFSDGPRDAAAASLFPDDERGCSILPCSADGYPRNSRNKNNNSALVIATSLGLRNEPGREVGKITLCTSTAGLFLAPASSTGPAPAAVCMQVRPSWLSSSSLDSDQY